MKQLYLINEFKKKSIEDCTISAVLMYGSFIKGEGDKFSDIEFYIFLRDDCHIDKYKWISSVNPIALMFVNEFGTDVVIFDNLIRGEFHFLPLKEISIIKSWQGHTSFEFKEKMNLVDKDGLLTDVLNDIEPPYEPIRNTPAQIEWLADSLINNLLFASNLFQRGEYAHLHNIFQYIQKHTLWLIRIYEQSEKHWESPTKKLEVDISSYWYNKYQTIDIEDIVEIFQKVYRTLKPGGIFLFNIEHPVFTAGVGQDWIYTDDGKPQYWAIDNYFITGERNTHFLGCDVVKQHHTLTQIIMGLLNNGFELKVVEEAEPPKEMMDIPGMEDELRRPMMLLVKAIAKK